MLYEKFIRLVEDHAEEITKEWISEIKANPSTAGYRRLNDEVLNTRVYDVYKRLRKWVLENDINDSETAKHFMKLGNERASEGLKNSEVVYALILARVVLCRYIENHGLINSSLELHQLFEFYQTLNNFFDKATYFVAVGFENQAKLNHLKSEKKAFSEKAVQGVTDWFIKSK